MSGFSFVFDVGNTRIKGAKFLGDQIIDDFSFDLDKGFPVGFEVDGPAIISTVSTLPDLSCFAHKPLEFDKSLPIPIALDYETINTLGKDRIAGAVGASFEFPEENSLIIDCGTCVNYDFIDHQAVFKGGVISPGLKMRLRAMHSFTENLPDLTADLVLESDGFPGKSTKHCMQLGAKMALLNEIEGFVQRFQQEFGLINVILTGGDASFFESSLKGDIFVRPKIVLTGLNRILRHNVAV